MAIQEILVEIPRLDSARASFESKAASLKSIKQTIDSSMDTLSKTVWESPASQKLKAQYDVLSRQVEEAHKIIDEYALDLGEVRQKYSQIETQIEAKAASLQTDVFGV